MAKAEDRSKNQGKPRQASEKSQSMPIWLSPAPGRHPRFDRDIIAKGALEIADSDGIDAVSMRRVATHIGAGTMTLYYYVRTKDDLLALMFDAIIGELLVAPNQLGTTWREGFTQIARQTRKGILAHPWAPEAMRGPQIGPNALQYLEQALSVSAKTGQEIMAQLEIISTIDDFVFGHTIRYIKTVQDSDNAEDPGTYQALFSYVQSQLGLGKFPAMEKVFGKNDVPQSFQNYFSILTDESRFERGLDQLLEGISRRIEAG
jgi:AcrR family transcriptional regulator